MHGYSADRCVRGGKQVIHLTRCDHSYLGTLHTRAGVRCRKHRNKALRLFHARRRCRGTAHSVTILRSTNMPCRLLRSDHLTRIRPTLTRMTRGLANNLRLPGSRAKSYRLFARGLTQVTRRTKIGFHFGAPISRLLYSNRRVCNIGYNSRIVGTSTCIVTFNSCSATVLGNVISVPICPLGNCSLAVPVTRRSNTPMSAVLSRACGVTVAHFSGHVHINKVTRVINFGARLLRPHHRALRVIIHSLCPHNNRIRRTAF